MLNIFYYSCFNTIFPVLKVITTFFQHIVLFFSPNYWNTVIANQWVAAIFTTLFTYNWQLSHIFNFLLIQGSLIKIKPFNKLFTNFYIFYITI